MKPFLGGMAVALVIAAYCFSPLAAWLPAIQLPVFASTPKPLPPPPPAISAIRGMSTLVTEWVQITDSIEGRNGHFEGKWSLHGDILFGIDLKKVEYVRTDQDRLQATLRLPQPHVVQHKIDHEASEELYLRSVSWFPSSSPQLLRAECWKMADRKLAELGKEQGYRERAKVEAERTLEKFFQGVGWKVTFEWEDTLPAAQAAPPALAKGNE